MMKASSEKNLALRRDGMSAVLITMVIFSLRGCFLAAWLAAGMQINPEGVSQCGLTRQVFAATFSALGAKRFLVSSRQSAR
jgi:hypothetical protein